MKFTACGLFPLNYTLIYSVSKEFFRMAKLLKFENFFFVLQIAGAVTTYLVILLQFQSADKSTAVNCAPNVMDTVATATATP